MSDTFTPLLMPAFAAEEPAFAPLSLKLLTSAAASTPIDAVKPAGAEAASPAACAPVITLQRNGDTVSRIRVQCSCGQVIELNCVYPESKS
jgi:hypothetical protein